MSKKQSKQNLVWLFDFYCGEDRCIRDKVPTEKQVAYIKEKGLDISKYTK